MRFRLRRSPAAVHVAEVPACRASGDDDPAVRDDGPAVRGDGTGWVSVNASPAWWRALPTVPDLPRLTEQWARIGELHLNPALCRAIGATTGRPCPIDVTNGPCPLHGEMPATDRCGSLTKAGTPCRWNTAAHGPCLSHRGDRGARVKVPAEAAQG